MRARDLRVAAPLEVVECFSTISTDTGSGSGVGPELEEQALLDAPRRHPGGSKPCTSASTLSTSSAVRPIVLRRARPTSARR